jgi:multidrug transporter EmrE-like cation transporter
MSNWIALILAIAGNIGANFAFKYFVQTTEFKRSWASWGAAVMQPSLWLGLFLGVMLLGCYIYAVRGIPLSIAYTVATSASIAGVTCVGVLGFGEVISTQAIVGIAIVMLGVGSIVTA